jgi:hypothetical protein
MTLVQARRIAFYLLAVFLLYAVIASPDGSADFVGLGFQAVSDAADGVGDLLAAAVG